MNRQSDTAKMKYTPKVGDRVTIVDSAGQKPVLGTINIIENENRVSVKRDDGRTGGGRYLDGYGPLWSVNYHNGNGKGVAWEYSMKPLNVSWKERITDD